MKTAIVTGASRGIGLAITRRLIPLGYRVYGLARSFERTEFSDDNFIAMECDITDTASLIRAVEKIRSGEEAIHLLVNNAGVGFFGPHEQLKPKDIQTMIRTNLEAPLVLCNLLLRDLKNSGGTILSISSAAAKKISTHGCAYAAAKAGLTHFSASLFEEVRKTGVKVTVIHPDITKSSFYDDLDFTYEDEPRASLRDEEIADAVEYVLGTADTMAVNEITIKPQVNRIKRKTAE